MNIRRHTCWILFPLFTLGCAKQTAPTGGPKDTIPPSMLASKPYDQETNYANNTIELTFNEQIILNNPKDQIIITPDLGNKFQAQAKKHTASIKFEQPLQPNTTYSLNFRDAVQDITEKNPAENLKLAFSTGAYIDSLSISGSVFDLLKSTEVKEATVALYQSDTFDIFKHKPIYFTKTDIKGKYHLTNLKPGSYSIYAVDDKNKNLVTESKSESYGYLATPITLTKDTANVKIPIIRLDTRPLKLTSARPSQTFYNIKTSKNLASYKLTASDPNVTLYSSFAEDHANIRIYNTFNLKDSLQIRFSATDSISNQIDTLLFLKYSTRTVTPEKFQVNNSEFRVIAHKGILTGTVSYNKPLLQINYDSIYYAIDSARIIKITAQDIRIDTADNRLTINKAFPKDLLQAPIANPTKNIKSELPPQSKGSQLRQKQNNYQIFLAKSTLISVEHDSSARISATVTPTKLENTGTISTTVNTAATHFIVQLLSKDYQVIASSYDQKTTTFEDLEPADYRIQLIIDENNDQQWNPGNYYIHAEPEPAIYYKNEKQLSVITLKANWELGPLLITY